MNIFKKVLFPILMVLIFSVFLAGLCEVLVRVFVGDKIPLFPRIVVSAPHGDFTIRTNTPNVSYRHRSQDGQWTVKINGQGFRSERDFPFEKPEGTKRVLLLGDSFTMASEVNIEDSFGAVMERELKKKGYNVEVINTGVSGYSNAEELVVLENKGLKFRPDAVVLSFFINDYTDNLRAGLYRLGNNELIVSRKEYSPGGKVQTFLRRFPAYLWIAQNSYFYNYMNRVLTMALKGKIEKENADRLIAEVGVADMETYQKDLAFALVKKISETSRANGAFFELVDIPTFWDERSIKFKDRLEKEKVTDIYADSLDLFGATDRKLLYRPNGDRHWTELGHKIVGEYLAEKTAETFRRLEAEKAAPKN